MQQEYIYFNGERIARRDTSTGNVHYYLSDQLGSASVIVNGTNYSVQEQTDYYPFGSIAFNSAEVMGMPTVAGADGYPFVIVGQLAPDVGAITRFAPPVAGGGTGGAIELVVESGAEAIEVLAFTMP